MESRLQNEAQSLAQELRRAGRHLVLAESCTGGLASATLAGIAGISQWHCGSAVTYRERTKSDWLGVSPDLIQDQGVVSDGVARAMAQGVLTRTPEADLAAAITGHLGPDAPAGLDGVVYVAVASRQQQVNVAAWRHELQTSTRHERQAEAAALLLHHARRALHGE